MTACASAPSTCRGWVATEAGASRQRRRRPACGDSSRALSATMVTRSARGGTGARRGARPAARLFRCRDARGRVGDGALRWAG
eukprot:scaffold8782_cov60-Phaeocystis_antarctica.AAC.2